MAPKSSILVSVMVFAYIAYDVTATQCPPNQVFQDCGGCERTCDNAQEDFITCPPICRPPGCYCVSGTVRNVQGQCVHPDACPGMLAQSCPPNEVFLECNWCESTCAEPWGNCGQCEGPGCFCDIFTVRNEQGECVYLDDCPAVDCPPNQEYSTCGSCEGSCERPDVGDCADECRVGCFCVAGTVRNQQQDCVKLEDC